MRPRTPLHTPDQERPWAVAFQDLPRSRRFGNDLNDRLMLDTRRVIDMLECENMIRGSGFRSQRKSDEHPAKGIMLMMGEFVGGFARMGKNHGQAALVGNPHFDRMVTIDPSRRQAEGRRDPVGGKQPATKQQQMHQPA